MELVLVERDPDRCRKLDEKKLHYVAGEATEEEKQWVSLIRDTYDLMDLCRSTQSDFMQSLLEFEAAQVNDGKRHPETSLGPHTRGASR